MTALFLVGVGNHAYAQWIAPGLLTKAHKDLRTLTSCLKCHTLAEGLDNNSCKSCHEELNKKIQDKQGLHARIKSSCVTCHTDHKGAEYDITSIDEKTFKHDLTGYELKDSHKVTCNNCHKKEDTYLGNSPECLKCHPEIHPKKTVPVDCIQCHTYKEWKDHIFDHTKAEFKLVGKHNDAKCELCHPRNTVEVIVREKEKEYQVMTLKPIQSETCRDCHYDVHKEQFENQVCDACHSLEKGWEDYIFRHESEKYTGFKLEGKHKDAECEKCHERSDISYSEFKVEKKLSLGKFTPIETDPCTNCHFDIHNGHFKKQKCDVCHSVEKGWKDYIFDHQSDKFSYRLEGKHKDAECVNCHSKAEVNYTEFKSEKKLLISKFEKITSDECTTCHFDVHNEQFKGQICDACHSVEKGWKDHLFKHESEKYKGFKLVGNHKEVECEKCHKRSEVSYTEFDKQKTLQLGLFTSLDSETCGNCHFDVHIGQFKDQKCDACHTPEKEWKEKTFTHENEKYEGYKLEGKHQKVECEKCHIRSEVNYTEFDKQKTVQIGLFKPLKNETCGDCHKNGHEEKFKEIDQLENVACTECHSVEREFNDRIYKHKEDSRYFKYNRDAQVQEKDCAACHFCDPNLFAISSCFDEMGMTMPGR